MLFSLYLILFILNFSSNEAISVDHLVDHHVELSKATIGNQNGGKLHGLSTVSEKGDNMVQLNDQLGGVTETSTVSYGSRIKDSLANFLIGLLCFVISFPILIWNECKSAKQYRLLDGAENEVRKNLNANELSPENQGKLVHVQGEIKTVETLGDDKFGIQVQGCLKLKRIVQMYQWVEHVEERREDNLGGSQTVTRRYTYSKGWADYAVSSHDFKESGHDNPPFPNYRSDNWVVRRAHFGDYILGPPLIEQATWWQDHEVTEKDLQNVEESIGKDLKTVGQNFYRGKSEQYPEIGDVKIEFHKVPCDMATVMGRQIGNSFEGWEPVLCPCCEKIQEDAKYDEERQRLLLEDQAFTIRLDHILYLTREHVSVDYIIEQRRQTNLWVTWIWRAVGFCLMCGGLYGVFSPIITLLAVVPFFANIIGGSLFIVCFITTLVLTLVIVSLSWVLARPLLVTCLVSLGVGIVVLVSFVK